jgi:hypothetical protein
LEKAAADSPAQRRSTPDPIRHPVAAPISGRRVATQAPQSRSPRSMRSAQAVIMDIGGRKSQLDRITDHHGTPIGDLNYFALANAHDETPMFQQFAKLLMESGMPKSERQTDVARKFYSPEEADRMWLDLFKKVA